MKMSRKKDDTLEIKLGFRKGKFVSEKPNIGSCDLNRIGKKLGKKSRRFASCFKVRTNLKK